LPAYRDSKGRLLDHAARLRLLLAAQSAVGVEVEVARVHAAAVSPGYGTSLDARTRTFSVESRFERGRGTPDLKVAF